MNELIDKLKTQIIEALNLEDMTISDIDTEAPLFGSGLGLDSIDALELIVLLEREYGIKLTNPAEGKEIFRSVATIADYVSKTARNEDIRHRHRYHIGIGHRHRSYTAIPTVWRKRHRCHTPPFHRTQGVPCWRSGFAE